MDDAYSYTSKVILFFFVRSSVKRFVFLVFQLQRVLQFQRVLRHIDGTERRGRQPAVDYLGQVTVQIPETVHRIRSANRPEPKSPSVQDNRGQIAVAHDTVHAFAHQRQVNPFIHFIVVVFFPRPHSRYIRSYETNFSSSDWLKTYVWNARETTLCVNVNFHHSSRNVSTDELREKKEKLFYSGFSSYFTMSSFVNAKCRYTERCEESVRFYNVCHSKILPENVILYDHIEFSAINRI